MREYNLLSQITYSIMCALATDCINDCLLRSRSRHCGCCLDLLIFCFSNNIMQKLLINKNSCLAQRRTGVGGGLGEWVAALIMCNVPYFDTSPTAKHRGFASSFVAKAHQRFYTSWLVKMKK